MARDRFGEKPLFFYQDGQQFLFASEMKALWAAGVKKEPNRKMIFNFITLGYTQNPANGFKETFLQRYLRACPPARHAPLYDAPSDTDNATVTHRWQPGHR